MRSVENQQHNKLAVTGFCLGVLSVLYYELAVIPILGIAISAIALETFEPEKHKSRWMAGCGLGLSIICMVLAITAHFRHYALSR
jgi:hypothetical protein